MTTETENAPLAAFEGTSLLHLQGEFDLLAVSERDPSDDPHYDLVPSLSRRGVKVFACKTQRRRLLLFSDVVNASRLLPCAAYVEHLSTRRIYPGEAVTDEQLDALDIEHGIEHFTLERFYVDDFDKFALHDATTSALRVYVFRAEEKRKQLGRLYFSDLMPAEASWLFRKFMERRERRRAMAQLERAKAEHDLPLVSALTEVVAVLDANTVPQRLRADKSD
jgi:hypothetical protein